jgi:hypothetical protein
MKADSSYIPVHSASGLNRKKFLLKQVIYAVLDQDMRSLIGTFVGIFTHYVYHLVKQESLSVCKSF